MTTHTALLCPKCGGHMRTYERSAIVVEQCEDCRGIFLDRGELERLIDAEGGGWSGRVAAPSSSQEARAGGDSAHRQAADTDSRDVDDRRRHRPRRRETGLSSLRDLFGD